MRTIVNQIEVPNEDQRALDERAIAVFATGGTFLAQPASPTGMPVFIMGGTSTSNVTFTGSISTDIGNVKIEDADENYAVIPDASAAKTGDTNALVIQHIDPSGNPLWQSTQVQIMQNQGTLATAAGVAAVDSRQGTLATQATLAQVEQTLVTVMNNQGTLTPIAPLTTGATESTLTRVMNNQGTLATSANQVTSNSFLNSINANQATSALQTAGNASLVTIANQTALLATDTGQTAGNSTLTAILNSQGTQATAPILAPLGVIMNNQGTLATSALQTSLNAALVSGISVVANNQGTQATAAGVTGLNATTAVVMNNQGTLATSANQATQLSFLSTLINTQGTQATSALQAVANDTLSKLYNAQGTASVAVLLPTLTTTMNNQGTLATSALQNAQNAVQVVIMNNQGTQATSALQAQGNNTLTSILNNEGTLATSANQVTSNAYLLTLATDSPLQATAANQIATNNQLASIVRTYGASGTAATASNSVLMALDPSAVSTDAFGRLRVSNPDFRFDGQLCYQISPDLWDTAFKSGGTVAYDSVNRMAQLTSAANGTAVMQGHYCAPYTPGRSQLALMTFQMGTTPGFFTTRRVGYWDGSDGIYLEQAWDGVRLVLASTTSNGNQSILQASWNIDKMDGTGPSGITLDLSKVQILVISFQALYAGRVIVGFDINGILWPVHAFTHANKIAVPYIAQASLPVRYEAKSTGSNTVSFKALCASVMSEGGGPLSSIPARAFSANGGVSLVTVSTRRPIISVRCKSAFNALPNNGIVYPTDADVVTGTQGVLVEIVRNAVFTGTAWTSVNVDSLAEFDTSATAISGGQTLYSSYVASTAAQEISFTEVSSRVVVAYSALTGASDTLSVVMTSLAGNTNCEASLNWREIR